MCTALTFKTNDHYFGRNLDLEYTLGESVTITPRNFPLSFRCVKPMISHYAMIGAAITAEGYPLYYDATNEMGLSIAGLNFPGNAVYFEPKTKHNNIAPFEFIPWILGQCKSVADVRQLLKTTNITNIPFSSDYPLSPLHWIIADSSQSITVESVSGGLMIYENPVGILTNNPPFEYHLQHLCHHLNLTRDEPENRFSTQIKLIPYSRGMGAIGMPGDLSSSSRFVRATFSKFNSICNNTEEESVGQFFHILDSVAQIRGCVKVEDAFEVTQYSSCCNTNKGIYYYTTYENRQISCIHLHKEDLNASKLISYSMLNSQQIRCVN